MDLSRLLWSVFEYGLLRERMGHLELTEPYVVQLDDRAAYGLWLRHHHLLSCKLADLILFITEELDRRCLVFHDDDGTPLVYGEGWNGENPFPAGIRPNF